MGIIDFYKGILSTAGCGVDQHGQVHVNVMGCDSPINIDGKQLVMPTKEVLANPDWNKYIAFHPLCESILTKESPVMRRFKLLTITRINAIVNTLLEELMHIALDEDRRKRLSPDQSEYLMALSKADGKTLTVLSKLLDTMNPKLVSKRLVSIRVAKNSSIGDMSYKRVASVTFPILDSKKYEGNELLSVNMGSQKNKSSVLALFQYIFPDSDVKDTYSAGSNDLSVPGMHAYLTALVKIYERLDSIVDLFADVLSSTDDLRVDLSWVEGLDKLKKYRALIPVLPGNSGDPIDGEEEPEEDVVVAKPAAPAPQRRQIAFPTEDVKSPAAAPAPAAQSTAPAATAAKTSDSGSAKPHWRDKLANDLAANRTEVPMYYDAPAYAPPPPPQYQQPQYQYPQHQAYQQPHGHQYAAPPPPPPQYYQQPQRPQYAPAPGVSAGRAKHYNEEAMRYQAQYQQPQYPQGHQYPPQHDPYYGQPQYAPPPHQGYRR